MPIQMILELVNRAKKDKQNNDIILKEIESLSVQIDCYTRDMLDR